MPPPAALSRVSRPPWAATQCWAILAYTALFTMLDPGLWLAPLGELLKNVPLIVLAIVAWAIADER